ncbi:hypothetical protein DX928_15595 [Bacillus swezeyi]|uniref:Uncharacterized protein n=2 Tax=Bacillus swezeyi TaxID=1925020 RepID=A0A5M8RX62_9BACI|nr:hypothetical protein DX927_05805 [Bacillus swezeyi]KAA6475397.1 hypothetical protein DX928_15595 [Bacillus swezeyi]
MNMNNSKILKQLYDKFFVNEENQSDKTTITIYPKNSDGSINLDTGIKLKNSTDCNSWRLFEAQRDKEYELGTFNTKYLGLVALYIAVKGKFERIDVNEKTKEELRSIEGDLKKGQTILQNNLSKRYFSLNKDNEEKEGSINVYEEGGKYYIYYLSLMGEKIWITKARPMKSALVVTYNYGSMLEEFDRLIKISLSNLSVSLEEEEHLKRIYIGK